MSTWLMINCKTSL